MSICCVRPDVRALARLQQFRRPDPANEAGALAPVSGGAERPSDSRSLLFCESKPRMLRARCNRSLINLVTKWATLGDKEKQLQVGYGPGIGQVWRTGEGERANTSAGSRG